MDERWVENKIDDGLDEIFSLSNPEKEHDIRDGIGMRGI